MGKIEVIGLDGPIITASEFLIVSTTPSDGLTLENLTSNTSGSDWYDTGEQAWISTSSYSPDYTFKYWTKNGAKYTESNSFYYTVETENVSFVAVYAYEPQSPSEPDGIASYRLYLKSNLSGSCSFNRTSGEKVKSGSSVYVSAYTNFGYKFKGWYVGNNKQSDSRDFYYQMPEKDVTLTAHFEYDPENPNDPQSVADQPIIPKIKAKNYTREYGDENPEFDYTEEGRLPLDGTPFVTCVADNTSAPGEYPIVITRGTETNADVTYVNGTLTVTKAPLTITAKSYTIREGDALPTTVELEYEGFKNGETETSSDLDMTALDIKCTAADSNTPGTYAISVCGITSNNYDITFVDGTLAINPESSSISITDAGMATYCSEYDLDFTNVTDLKAYIITGYDWQSKKVYAMRVYDVPAGTGLYLVGKKGDYDVNTGSSTSYYINMLVGTLCETWIEPTDGDYTNLRLTGSSPSDASFKKLTQGRNFSANKAYLQIPTAILDNSASAIGIIFDDETDGIENIGQGVEYANADWFTLDGCKLNGKPSAKGVYVVKGKKVVIK